MDPLVALLSEQDGVLARNQVVAHGGNDDLIRKMIRRRAWSRVHTGVYVNHTGTLTWLQRVWAALLFYGDSVVCHESALRAHRFRSGNADDLIHVAVDRSRRVTKLPKVRVHLVELRQGECLESLGRRPKLPRRSFLLEVLDDVAAGAYSVLEHKYLTRVERPHGLPTAKRQRRVHLGRSPAYRDVEYLGLATVVELDGRLGHEETGDRWDDMDRDLDTAGTGRTTLRIGWRQVENPCRTAGAVAAVLRINGWSGSLHPCSSGCLLGLIGEGFQAPGA